MSWRRTTHSGATNDGRSNRKSTRRNSSPTNGVFNYTVDERYNGSSAVLYDLIIANGSTGISMTLENISATIAHRPRLPPANLTTVATRRYPPTGRQVPQPVASEPVYRYRHHGHGQLPIEQHSSPPSSASSSVSISYRMQSAAGVGVIASVFFCATLFTTVALGVFCRKRNTVFAFQKSEQVDYSSAAGEDNADEDLEWFEDDDDDELNSCSVRLSVECDDERHRQRAASEEQESSTDCETSVNEGCGSRKRRETRLNRIAEWQLQRKRKRKRLLLDLHDSTTDDDRFQRDAHSKAGRVPSNRQVKTAVKRPETLALNCAQPPLNNDDSDTTSCFFRCESVGDLSSVPSVVGEAVGRSVTTTSFLSAVCRRSMSISASLADEASLLEASVAGSSVGKSGSSGGVALLCRSQPVTPGYDFSRSSSMSTGAAALRRAVVGDGADRMPCGIANNDTSVPESDSQSLSAPGHVITAGRVEPAQCHSVLTLSDTHEY